MYKNKYIKYKIKYLNLKNQHGGNISEIILLPCIYSNNLSYLNQYGGARYQLTQSSITLIKNIVDSINFKEIYQKYLQQKTTPYHIIEPYKSVNINEYLEGMDLISFQLLYEYALVYGTQQIKQDAFIEKTWQFISNTNIDILKKSILEYCEDLLNIILNNSFEFINDYRAKIVINMFLVFIPQYIPTFTNWDLQEKLQQHCSLTTEFGSVLKQYNLTNLTPCPDNAIKILNSCINYEKYSIMAPHYLIVDYEKVNYLCTSNEPDIIRISSKNDLNTKITTNEQLHYLYCLLPDNTLCLFQEHHSAGACGQPVICAGSVILLNKIIIQINNSSGHYAPDKDMLQKCIDILHNKKPPILAMGILERVGSSFIYNYKIN